MNSDRIILHAMQNNEWYGMVIVDRLEVEITMCIYYY